LKAPLGLLIQGSFKYTTERLKELVDERNPKKLIAVGDRVSRNIIEKGMHLDVAVVDNKVMRKPIAPIKFKAEKTYWVSNPAGTLTDEAWQAIEEAVNYNGQVKVLVDGEEDLLALVAVLSAPENSMVIYGQPRRGIVVVNVTEATKKKILEMVERMEDKLSKD